MPDRRRHRGPHPGDPGLFAPEEVPRLRGAVADLAWLLGRGYADRASLKLVGDRYRLRERQRLGVYRATCSDDQRADRSARRVALDALKGATVLLDGYNVLITVEAALAGGVLLRARDGCLRDLASLHGSFRQVEETLPALGLVGTTLAAASVAACVWVLDRPVSNSGRLAARMRALAAESGWSWDVRLEASPDGVLARARSVVATSDSVVLDRCGPWLDLARHVVERHVPDAWTIDLGTGS